MVFRSKVDGWLVWFVRGSMLGATALLTIIAFVTNEGQRMVVIAAAFVFILYVLAEWLIRSIYYTVDQDFLRIRPFRSRVLIADIESISQTNGRVEIRFSGRQIYVSPRESDLFVETLRSVNGKIQLI